MWNFSPPAPSPELDGREMGDALKRVRLAQSATSTGRSTIPISPCCAPLANWPDSLDLRVGYGAFPEWLLPQLWKIKQPYNVNVAATLAAIASLEDMATLQDNLDKLIAERDRLSAALSELEFLAAVSVAVQFHFVPRARSRCAATETGAGTTGHSRALLRQAGPARLHPHQRGEAGTYGCVD